MAWDEFRKSLDAPGKILVCGVVMLLFAVWNHATTYAPSDITPLHDVTGKLASTETKSHFHRNTLRLFNTFRTGRGWFGNNVTLHLADGQSIHYTEREREQRFASYPLATVPAGASIQAQADDTGEIWQLSADGREVISLAGTLARHHRIRHFRNVVDGILVLLGLGMLGFAALRRKPA